VNKIGNDPNVTRRNRELTGTKCAFNFKAFSFADDSVTLSVESKQ
jgi:hypothetical protein